MLPEKFLFFSVFTARKSRELFSLSEASFSPLPAVCTGSERSLLVVSSWWLLWLDTSALTCWPFVSSSLKKKKMVLLAYLFFCFHHLCCFFVSTGLSFLFFVLPCAGSHQLTIDRFQQARSCQQAFLICAHAYLYPALIPTKRCVDLRTSCWRLVDEPT